MKIKLLAVLPWAVVVSTRTTPKCNEEIKNLGFVSVIDCTDSGIEVTRVARYKNGDFQYSCVENSRMKDCEWIDDMVEALNDAHQRRTGPKGKPNEAQTLGN